MNVFCFQPLSQVLTKEAITGAHGELDGPQAAEGTLAQAASDGITNDQCPNQRRAADGRAQYHAQVRARVEAQTAAN
jgi:hypothetical protein